MDGRRQYVLGLDLGVASIGWALVAADGSGGEPQGIMAMGTHLFEAGTEGGIADIEKGKDEPRNLKRRQARLMRRQIWRRARRKRKLLRLLIEHGLLPSATASENGLKLPANIDAYMKRIDGLVPVRQREDAGIGHGRDGFAQIWTRVHDSVPTAQRARAAHENQLKWPYLLRSAAASRRVELYELGRALYHLAQRRGFLSNRRADAKKSGKDDEDKSKVKKAIGELAEKLEAHAKAGGVPTLGGYFATLKPDDERVRGRWTARKMYEDEFDAIWAQQTGLHAASHPPLADDATRQAIHDAIFHQRPLKSQSHLIGRCSLEPDQPRAPIAHRLFQRFRVLQQVNHIEVAEPGQAPRALSAEERTSLLAKLLRDGDTSFADAKKIMGFKRSVSLNLERGEAKKLIGHRTDAKLRDAVGDDRFDALSEAERDALTIDVRQFRSPEALAARGRSRWGLEPSRAAALAEVALEEDRGSVSLAAIRTLMPLLEAGMTYGEARRKCYPESFRSTHSADELPPVLMSVPELRNPSVARALTEARKLVNELVRAHGKPMLIRVELARDLKNPRAIRERITKDNREREKAREAQKARILSEVGLQRPSRHDIEKALLWDECGGQCPYTGRHIEFGALFGRSPQFDVEHIWPRSRCLDDSFLNKTLCEVKFNRERKKNRTPFEIFGGSGAEWDQALQRVRAFKGDLWARREKLRRFMAEAIDEGFENRHLSDSRYISRAAADYLGLLYGGRVQSNDDGQEVPGTKKIFTPTGGLTSWLRSGWGLNTILAPDVEPWEQADKNRQDHRHHAIDALVIALSDDRAVKFLSEAASKAESLHRRRAFEEIKEPWDGFRGQVAAAVEKIVVSHRQSRKVSGALHKESNYSRPIHNRGSDEPEHRIRKELAKLTPSEIAGETIVDARARDAIRAVLAAKGKQSPTPKDITQIFSDPANLPMVKGHDGRMVRLRKVRVRTDPAVPIGTGERARHVMTGSNHHTVIYAVKDKKGQEKWVDEPVTLMEAYRRVAAKEPVVRRNPGNGKRFLFSLAPGEFIEMDVPDAEKGDRVICRVSKISVGDMELKEHLDARSADAIKQAKARIRVSGEKLRKLNAKKVRITYLGEVKPCGG